MLIRRLVASIFSVGLMVLGVGVASGQDYPNKPIRFVTSSAGGSADFVARLIAAGLSGPLGQQVIVDNRGSAVMGEIGAKAPADGYTLLLAGPTFWAAPFFRRNLSWDPVRDFSPITLAARAPNILVVHPSLPVKSVKDLAALASAKPGELNYATGGAGSTPHLAAELFKSMAGVNIVRINYKGGGPAVTALLSGEVPLMFATAGSVAPHVKSGRLRALAVTSAEPSAVFPDLPTVAASGLPGYESVTIYGVFAPIETPATIINRLNQEIVRAVKRPDVREKFLNSGVETIGSSPQRLATAIKSEMALLSKVSSVRDK